MNESTLYPLIFFHIPKNAGVSIRRILEIDTKMHPFNFSRTTNLGIDIKKYTDPEVFKRYTKFTVIRNPWDRFLSEYIWQGNNFKTAIETKWGNKNISFVDFCKSDFNWYPEYEKNRLSKTQLSFLTDDKAKICVDKLIKFENLQKEFSSVFDKIGIAQMKIPHRNKTKHKSYWEYYNDETIEIVTKKFEEDIKFFGYEFGK